MPNSFVYFGHFLIRNRFYELFQLKRRLYRLDLFVLHVGIHYCNGRSTCSLPKGGF